ncbi:MAG: DUF58 domain-containing protein [Armatimonadota bacterium]
MQYLPWGLILVILVAMVVFDAPVITCVLFAILASLAVVVVQVIGWTIRTGKRQAPVRFDVPKTSPPSRSDTLGYTVLWIVVLLVMMLISETSKSWLLGLLFYILATLVVFALLVIRRPARLLSVTRRLSSSHAEIGQPVSVEVTVDVQRAAGPGWILAQDTLPDTIRPLSSCGRLFVSGAEPTTSFSYRAVGSKRGYYPVGPVGISSGDLLGLTQVTAQSEERRFLTIHPKVCPMPPICMPSNRPIGDARSEKRIFEDPTRIVGIRDYTPGDPLSKIHWKTTARTGTLATKMCESSSSIEVNIVLNLHVGDYPPRDNEMELAFTTAASVATSLLADRHVVGLQSNGYDAAWRYGAPQQTAAPQVKSDKGPLQLAAILSLLGRLELSQAPKLSEYLTQVHSTLPWTSTILLITHYLCDEDAAALEGLQRAGFELAAIIVGYGQYAEASMARVVALGAPAAMVKAEKELAYLEFWQPGRA